jgi:hypothetical protein
MSTTPRKLLIPADARVLGERAFAAISAVEGIALTADSRQRLAAMRRRNLSPEEQRAEIIRAYAGVKARG